jgi:O-antigen ligase
MITLGLLRNIKNWSTEKTDPLGRFALSYSLYIALSYLVSSPFFGTAFFLICVIPTAINVLRLHEGNATSCLETRGCLWACVFILYAVMISPFSSLSLSIGVEKTLIPALETAAFFMASLLFFTHIPYEKMHRFFLLLTSVVGFCALASLMMHASSPEGLSARLAPLGRASHPILGALVYGSVGIIALYLSLNSQHLWERLYAASVSLLVGILIFFTGSRAPLGIYLMSTTLILFAFQRSHRTSLKRIALTLLWGLCIPSLLFMSFLSILSFFREESFSWVISFSRIGDFISGYSKEALNRGGSLRPEIWTEAWARIQEKAFFGHGIHGRITLPPTDSVSPARTYHIHNLFLGTLFHMGIPGALLFYTYLIWAFKEAIRQYLSTHPLCILSSVLFFFALLSGIFDLSQPIKPPGPIWIIFWFPLAFLIANQTNFGNRASFSIKT